MAIDPRYLSPAYWASLPNIKGTLPGSFGDVSAFPSEFHYSMIPNLLRAGPGEFNAAYVANALPKVGEKPSLENIVSEARLPLQLSSYFGFNDSDPVFSSLSPTAKDYLRPWNGLSRDTPVEQWPTPSASTPQFTPQDYSTINAAFQPYRQANDLYTRELIARVQRGDIKVTLPKSSLFGSIVSALPGIVGAVAGGPIGGAIGGAISGNLSGGGLRGILTGALTGGIAGNGGLGSTIGDIGGLFGGSTGGRMNIITDALRGFTNASWNPFSIGNIQGLLPSSILNSSWGSGLSEFLSGGIPGALVGGALNGGQGALYGGLLGGALGYGSNQFGTGGPLTLDDWISNALFGGNNVGGAGTTGGPTGGSSGGSSGTGGLFGQGGLGGLLGGTGGLFGGGSSLLGLLGGAGMLKLLTNEATKVSDTPTKISTPFSSVNNGVVSLDPTIRNSFMESMGNFRGLFDQAGGNQGAYIQARVNPMEQQFAQQRGALERSLGLRGVSGSSFGDQSMTNFDIDSQRALGDARALATNDAIRMQGQLSQLLGQGGEQMLRQEIGALQFGNQNIENLLARAKIRSDIFGRAAAGAAGLLGA